ncbi:hemerythrin domain-containing protein [Streptomyces griseofuscus]|uniref:hemerythrin domain-containing protein n=1 Tax=Streptomyces griseofuscus TaxID=146922 RepID=UPI003825B605
MSHAPEGRADVRDMLVVHETFRVNFGRLPGLITAVVPGDRRRANIIANHARLIEQFLHLHHKGEDELLWPKLIERAGDRLTETVEVLETQHVEIADLLEQSAALLDSWQDIPTREGGQKLADAIGRLDAVLTAHLAIEEEQVLPVVPEYITEAEWHELGSHAIEGLPKRQLPIVFGMLAAHTDADTARLIISPAPLVPRLIMPVIGPRAYRSHIAKVLA